MLSSKEESYPGLVLISFWCDYDIENLYFLRFRILADISVLLILAIIKIWQYSYTAQMLSFGYAHWPRENCQENCFSFLEQNSRWPTNHIFTWFT